MTMTLDDQQAIDCAYRNFAAHLIVSSITILHNRHSAVSSAYDALCFLRSEECIYLVRLLIGLDSMSDAEITRVLIDAHRSRGIAPDRPCDF